MHQLECGEQRKEQCKMSETRTKERRCRAASRSSSWSGIRVRASRVATCISNVILFRTSQIGIEKQDPFLLHLCLRVLLDELTRASIVFSRSSAAASREALLLYFSHTYLLIR